MVTRTNPRQIKGVTMDSLKEELLKLHHNVGYFLGNVKYFLDLDKLEPELGNVAFVEEGITWVYWNGTNWIPTANGSGGGPVQSALGIGQVTKLNLVGVTPTYPKIVDIPVPYTADFKRTSVEVLKFRPTEDDKVSTLVDFLNTDQSDFHEDGHIKFTGSMSPQTVYQRELKEQETTFERGHLFTIPLSINEFADIKNITIK